VRIRHTVAALGAALIAGTVSTGGSALAASTTHANPSTATVAACCFDHRGHQGSNDHHDWNGRGWDHRGWRWGWENQCDWAWHHDRGWWSSHCS
jgi:hypothetical protein